VTADARAHAGEPTTLPGPRERGRGRRSGAVCTRHGRILHAWHAPA